jgi:hypothetical protein
MRYIVTYTKLIDYLIVKSLFGNDNTTLYQEC